MYILNKHVRIGNVRKINEGNTPLTFSLAGFVLALALGFLLSPLATLAQASTGQIRGTVVDQTGALVTGASVSIRDQSGAKREVTTGANGEFLVTLLQPGTYRVEVKATGFKQYTLDNVGVRITETTGIEIKLEVGAESQEVVNVSAGSALVNTESSGQGRVIEERSLRQLPLPTRNFQQLLSLSAGAASNIANTSEVGRGDTAINVNGQRTTSNSVIINGIDANSIGTGSFANLAVPATDTLQEFIVQTSQYDASAGRNIGGIVAAVTKSGNNEFHGNLYYFLRNERLNSNSFFLNRQGIDRQKNNRNQYGATIGGPVVKDKVFFFGSYQGTRETNGTSLNNSVAVVTTAPDLTDDRSPAALAAISRARAPFFNGLVNPISQRLLQARLPNGDFLIPSGNGATSRVLVSESTFREEQFNSNGDWQINGKNRLSGKFFFANNTTNQGLFRQFGGGNALQTPGYPVEALTKNRVTSVSDTHVFDSGLVNEFRFGYNRLITAGSPTEPFNASDFGIRSPVGDRFPGLPGITLINFFSIGPATTSDSVNTTETFTFADTLNYIRGNHSMKFGGEYRINRQRINFNVASRGAVQFTGAIAGAAALGALAQLGVPAGSVVRPDAFTEFLLAPINAGIPSRTNGLAGSVFSAIGPGGAEPDIRARDYALFFQDDWKVNNRLTVNLGLRYDYYAPFTEAAGKLITFDETIPGAGRAGTFNGFIQAGNARNPLPGIPLGSDSLTDADRNNFAPRIGFAFKPTNSNKFVMRGGYGVYFDRLNARTVLNTAFSFPFYSLAPVLPGIPGRSFADPFLSVPRTLPVNTGDRTLFPNGGLPLTLGGVATPVQGIYPGRDLRTPYVQQFSFGFQWEFAKDTQVEVAYVGSLGRKLQRFRTPNQAPAPGGSVGPLSPTISSVTGVRNQSFAVTVSETAANSSYNSLQVSLTRRLSKGLQGLVAYTYSHSIDEYSGQLTSLGTSDVSADYGNQRDFRFQRGSADFDRRQRLVASFVYDLPKFYGGNSQWGKQILNNWQVNGIYIVQTGLPFSVVSTDGLFDASRGSVAPNFSGDPVTSGDVKSRLDGFIQRSAFVLTTGAGNFGNTGRNAYRGPAQQNTDFSIVKLFPIADRQRLEFRTEVFNIFNVTNFANPVNVLSNPNFGRILEQATGPRIIQFAFKYSF